MLAKSVNDDACWLDERRVWRLFSGKPRCYSKPRNLKSGRLSGRLALAVDLAFDFDLPRRQAERRFCAVGKPAWMPV